MNGRERMSLAMRRESPDRVPVMCQLALGHYFLNAGLAPHEIWFTSEAFAKALVKLLGIEDERIRLEWISAAEGQRFADVINEFTDQVRDLGPSPFKGDN